MTAGGAEHAHRLAWQEVWRGLLAFFGLIVLAGAIAGVLSATLASDEPSTREQVEIGLLAQFGASLLVLVPMALVPSAAPLRGRGRVLSAVGLYFAFLLVWLPVTFFLVPAVWEAMDWPIEPQPHLEYFTGPLTPGWGAVALLTVCLVGPLVEEIVFRGYLHTGLRVVLGPIGAVLLVGGLFGLVHVAAGWHVLLPLTMIGWLFGWLRERSGGLLAPIVVHALHNSLTVGLVVTAPEVLQGVQESR